MSGPTAHYRLVNIGPEGRRKRFRWGLVALGIGVLLAILDSFTYAAPAYRIFLFPIFWLGALGLFQARDQVCVVLASRGQRNMDTSSEAVWNTGEMKEIRRKARAIHVKALIAAALLTFLSFFV
jgi:hypothetical protein